MICQKYLDLIPLFLLDELDSNSKEELESHLQSCINCKKEFDEMKIVIGSLENQNQNQMSDSEQLQLQNNIYKSIILRQSQKSYRTLDSVRSFMRIAAAIILFLTGYIASSFLSSEEKSLQNNYSAKINFQKQNNMKSNSFSSYRFSKEGLKVIAKGEKALRDSK